MILYHGSNMAIEKIDLSKCKPFKDFGCGFYTTPISEQALTMARRTVRIYNEGKPCITEFKCDDALFIDSQEGSYPAALRRAEPATNSEYVGMNTHKIHTLQNDNTPLLCGGESHSEKNSVIHALNIKKFDEPSSEWAKFVINNRNRKFSCLRSPECNTDNKYDVVIGPVANDDITALIDVYLSGILSDKALTRELTFRDLSLQVSFHTEKSIVHLYKTGVFYG